MQLFTWSKLSYHIQTHYVHLLLKKMFLWNTFPSCSLTVATADREYLVAQYQCQTYPSEHVASATPHRESAPATIPVSSLFLVNKSSPWKNRQSQTGHCQCLQDWLHDRDPPSSHVAHCAVLSVDMGSRTFPSRTAIYSTSDAAARAKSYNSNMSKHWSIRLRCKSVTDGTNTSDVAMWISI